MSGDEGVEEFFAYESGPYCRHWSDPSDCDVVCERCGHRCFEHGFGNGREATCEIEGCACEGWVES